MKSLEGQLQLYRNLGVPTNIIPKFKSHLKNNTARWEALKAGIDWYKSQPNSTTQPFEEGTTANAVSQDTQEDTGDGYGSGSDMGNQYISYGLLNQYMAVFFTIGIFYMYIQYSYRLEHRKNEPKPSRIA